jgi:hypothetical protein
MLLKVELPPSIWSILAIYSREHYDELSGGKINSATGTVKLMRTHMGLPAQPKSTRSIIDTISESSGMV